MNAKPSATELFANRQRAIVPNRTDELLLSPTVTTPTSSTVPQAQENNTTGLQDLQAQLDALPKVETFQLRFEEQYKKKIKEVADREGVTPETLLQALWVVAEKSPTLMNEAIAEAKEHHKRRETASTLKTTITRLSNTLKKLNTR